MPVSTCGAPVCRGQANHAQMPAGPGVTRGGKPNEFAPTGVTRWWGAIPGTGRDRKTHCFRMFGQALRGLGAGVNLCGFQPVIDAVCCFNMCRGSAGARDQRAEEVAFIRFDQKSRLVFRFARFRCGNVEGVGFYRCQWDLQFIELESCLSAMGHLIILPVEYQLASIQAQYCQSEQNNRSRCQYRSNGDISVPNPPQTVIGWDQCNYARHNWRQPVLILQNQLIWCFTGDLHLWVCLAWRRGSRSGDFGGNAVWDQ